MKSESIELITKALVKFQSEISGVEMNAINPFYKSKYADLITIIKTAKPILTKNGLAFTQLVNKDETGGVITTMLMHESGQWLAANTNYPINGKPQEQGSAITYMRRYALAAILGIAADPDDDGEAAQKINSPIDGALEEEMRNSGAEFKSKDESKAACDVYIKALEDLDKSEVTAVNRSHIATRLKAAEEKYKADERLLVYEKSKVKKKIDQMRIDWEIGE